MRKKRETKQYYIDEEDRNFKLTVTDDIWKEASKDLIKMILTAIKQRKINRLESDWANWGFDNKRNII